MREFYFALGTLAMSPFKQGIVTSLEQGAVKRSDRILVSGELDADVVTEQYDLAERPTVILNSPPYTEEQQSSILRDTHSIPADNTVVLYQGVVHHGRGIAPFLKAMPSMPNVSFCVVGEGPALERHYKHSATELGVADRVHWHGSVPYDELHGVTSSCDIGLCIIEPISKSYEYALPNKLFEYMMARKPVICTDLPALRQELTTRPYGMLIGRGLSAAEITSAVSQLQVPATYNAMKPTTTAAQAIAYDRQAQLAVDLFRELL